MPNYMNYKRAVNFLNMPKDRITILVDSRCVCWNATFKAYKNYPNVRSQEEREATILNCFFDKIEFICKALNTTKLVFAWDCSRETSIRRKLYPDYKNNRAGWNPEKEMPHVSQKGKEVMDKNLAIRKECEYFWKIIETEVVPNLGFKNCYKADGYEGDDIIASIIKSHPNQYFVIYSDDNDYIQLINTYVGMASVREYGGGNNVTIYNEARAMNSTRLRGLHPSRFAEVKALAGCHSDAVPGVKGIGENRALEYLITGTIRTPSGKPSLLVKKIEDAKANGELALWDKLVRLPLEGVPTFELQPDEFNYKYFTKLCDYYGLIQKQGSEFWSDLMGGAE